MGVIVYKANLGTTITGPEGKQRVLLAIARICSIFYTTSIRTLNMAASEPMEITYKIENRAAVALRTKEFDSQLVKELAAAETYEISLYVGVVQVRFAYNSDFHMDGAVAIELRTEYKEIMSKIAMGFVLNKNIIATQSFYDRAYDRIERVYDMMMGLFKKFLGDTLFHTKNVINVEKYNRDFFYFNFLGSQFVIKRRFA